MGGAGNEHEAEGVIDQDRLESEARLVALEYMLGFVLAELDAARGITEDQARERNAGIVEAVRLSALPKLDPAKAMLGADVTAEALERLLDVSSGIRASVRRA